MIIYTFRIKQSDKKNTKRWKFKVEEIETIYRTFSSQHSKESKTLNTNTLKNIE